VIPQVDLARQHRALRAELLAAAERVLLSGRFILGEEGRALEGELAALCGVRHAVGVNSGTDALHLVLRALGVGPGDEVITPAFSFVASASAVLHAGARPVFADIDLETYTVDPARVERLVTPRTRALVVVHLYGHPADMGPLAALAGRHGLWLVEDAAQAVGAAYAGRPVGSLGDAACLSFYPTKNLGACGDAGMVVTDQEEVAERVRRLRAHGAREKYQHDELGWSSRLDELQAALLRVKLRHLPAWTRARRGLAERYAALLGDLPLTLPRERPPARHVWHHYTIRSPRRDALANALAELGVGTALHYPAPLPGQRLFRDRGAPGEEGCPRAWQASREVLSLPCFAELAPAEVEEVARAIRQACGRIG
jgi:dTDP-4-amino-4,6-dideoxygalactose transaminase